MTTLELKYLLSYLTRPEMNDPVGELKSCPRGARGCHSRENGNPQSFDE